MIDAQGMKRVLVDAKYVDMIEGIDALIAEYEKDTKGSGYSMASIKPIYEQFIKELKELKK